MDGIKSRTWGLPEELIIASTIVMVVSLVSLSILLGQYEMISGGCYAGLGVAMGVAFTAFITGIFYKKSPPAVQPETTPPTVHPKTTPPAAVQPKTTPLPIVVPKQEVTHDSPLERVILKLADSFHLPLGLLCEFFKGHKMNRFLIRGLSILSD